MTYLIDAWLERPHPYLRILHRETGEVCAVLEEAALDELREQGDLDMSGLNSSEPGVLKELVRNLFLFCYSRALRPGGTDWN
ncbi:hypothetical protein [Pseudomonas putida]|uniref:PA4570 family protein n=1 Tax=Pseudomonas TaxID=286 RepID=UPI00159D30ED|nr:hypothetical protein [Pseudomonas putida]NVN66292.1 hypothetical protein [Pseudomonas putida]NVN71315.1 hypothetical protein [Pseudomonas putida]